MPETQNGIMKSLKCITTTTNPPPPPPGSRQKQAPPGAFLFPQTLIFQKFSLKPPKKGASASPPAVQRGALWAGWSGIRAGPGLDSPLPTFSGSPTKTPPPKQRGTWRRRHPRDLLRQDQNTP